MTTREILPQPESTYQLLLDAARTWPGGVATQWIPDPADHTRHLAWTYAELAGTVTRIANALTALGVRRQDAVTLASVNTSMLYAATLAAQAIGIAAPVNPALSGERIAELIRRTGSQVLVTAGPELDPQLWPRMLEVARQAGMTAVLALRPDGAHGDPPALGVTGDTSAGGNPDGRGPVVAYLDDVIAGQPAGRQAWPGPAGASRPRRVRARRGTTGAPKVAAHTHANRGDVRRPHRLRHPGAGPGRRRHQLAAAADRRRGPAAVVGARSLRPAHRAPPAGRLRAHRGDLASTWTRPGEERPGSVGRALPGQQVKAVRIGDDGTWADCAPGESGVLVIGGPAVFAGYLTDPRLGGPRVSREGAVRDGWLDTGDLGRVDAGGFVYLTGRAKDLIICGGHNIDPRVIEEALLRHPGVRGAVAVGRPDLHSGEVPVAYVVPADADRLDEAGLLAWAGTAIDEPAARPKRIYPITAIPVTAVGKPFKPALIADAAVRAVTEALAAAGLTDARAAAAHENGRLVVTVTGADPGRVRDAVAGFALTVRSGPSPARQTAAN